MNELKDFYKASNAGKFPVKLYYRVVDLDFSPLEVRLEEGEVLGVLRQTGGDQKECAKLLCQYIKGQLPEIKAEIDNENKE